jgi:alkylation response protein AidB-like acyl-CoA dehydrogenase
VVRREGGHGPIGRQLMDFELTDEQQELRRSIAEFGSRHLGDGLLDRDPAHEFAVQDWKRCAEFGIQGLPVPEEYGGGAADPLTIAIALEALGYGCADNGLLFSLNAQMWSAEIPLVRFGTHTQKLRYLPGLCDGSIIGVQGVTEAGTGSDALAMTTRAHRDGDGYVLNGAKTFITNAPVADMFVVFAVTDPASGFAGLSALLVERGTPGLSVGQPFRKMGLRTSPMSELVFSDCRVPEECRLGPEGAGMAIFNASMEWERIFILATAVGTMQRQVERCIAYARERHQFGQPIAAFQAVSHKIVDMKVRCDTARLLLYQTAWLKGRKRSLPLESAMTKLYLSDCFVASSMDALQIHGAYGYMEESGLERDVRDALGSRIYSGTSQIQHNLIARSLGL